jgi:hypothetical protein
MQKSDTPDSARRQGVATIGELVQAIVARLAKQMGRGQ